LYDVTGSAPKIVAITESGKAWPVNSFARQSQLSLTDRFIKLIKFKVFFKFWLLIINFSDSEE